MIRILLLCTSLVFFASCHGNDAETEKSTSSTHNIAPLRDSSRISAADTHFYWEADLDPKEGLVMRRATPIVRDSLNLRLIVARLNGLYPEIPFKVQHVSNDTVFLHVTDSRYLSQQMGSSGPEAWMGEVVYNLTELETILYVNINFKVRDHGAPGTYSRTDFPMR